MQPNSKTSEVPADLHGVIEALRALGDKDPVARAAWLDLCEIVKQWGRKWKVARVL
jgi:hypothetical protein